MALASLPGSFTLNGQRFTVWSGNPAFAKDSADGATFWAVNAKRSDRQMFFLVVRQDASGALTLRAPEAAAVLVNLFGGRLSDSPH